MSADRRRPSLTSGRTGLRAGSCVARGLVTLAMALSLAACGSGGSGSAQDSNAFVFLTVDFFSLNGTTPIASLNSSLSDRGTSTVVCVTLRNNLKNPTVTSATTLDNVVIRDYTVSFDRSDGGPAPGPFTFATSVLVPVGTVNQGAVAGNTSVVPVILVPSSAKAQPPLNPPPGLPLGTVAEVIFRARDGRGQNLSARGSLPVTFVGDNATDPSSSCAGPSTGGGTTGGGGGSTGGGGGTTGGGGGSTGGGSTGTGSGSGGRGRT